MLDDICYNIYSINLGFFFRETMCVLNFMAVVKCKTVTKKHKQLHHIFFFI